MFSSLPDDWVVEVEAIEPRIPVVSEEELRYKPVPEVRALAVKTKAEEVVAVVATEEAKVWEPVPEVRLRAVAKVLLPMVIVLALALLPILTAPVVVESKVMALAPVELRTRVVVPLMVPAPAKVKAVAEVEIVSIEATPVKAPAVETFRPDELRLKVSSVALPMVIVLAATPVPIRTEPVVVESKVMALAPVELRVKVVVPATVRAPESVILLVVKVWEPMTVPVMKVPTPALSILVAPLRVKAPAVMATLPVAVVMPVAPVMAPPEISMLVVSRAKVPEPPPIETRALEVPVPMLVAELVEALMLVVPVIVRPPVPCSRPEPELTPTKVAAPALLTCQVDEVPRTSAPVPELEIASTAPEAEA